MMKPATRPTINSEANNKAGNNASYEASDNDNGNSNVTSNKAKATRPRLFTTQVRTPTGPMMTGSVDSRSYW